jgi:putative endonuclease
MGDRLLRHNSGRSKYTKFGIPWQLVYLEEFKNKTEAYRRELEIKKKKSRNYIERLIAR